MNGAENILAHVEQRLGIKPGQTTPDGRFTLSVVECLGSCGTAPMMMVNEGYHENLNRAKVDELLEGLK
jgi:NADH-quinone oxidoreductase subunit E